jgi:hypothetical protein
MAWSVLARRRVWLFVATLSMWLLLRAISVSTWIRVVGTVLYPLLLTEAWYVAGFAELPPLALATAMAWLCFRGSLPATGAVLAIAIFLRLDYGLVFLSVIGATIIGPGGRGDTLIQRVSRLLVSFLMVASASVAVLAARGELTGYISTITGQLNYPNRALAFLGEPSSVIGHLKVVANLFFESRQRSLLLVVVILPLAVARVKPLRAGRPRNLAASIRTAPLNTLFVFTAAAAVVTLGLSPRSGDTAWS